MNCPVRPSWGRVYAAEATPNGMGAGLRADLRQPLTQLRLRDRLMMGLQGGAVFHAMGIRARQPHPSTLVDAGQASL